MRKSRLLVMVVCCFVSFCLHGFSQNNKWVQYSNSVSVYALAEKDDTIWAGTENGLVKTVKSNGEQSFYNNANSGLPYNQIKAIAIDKEDNKWIGTAYGLTKYNGSNWVTYDTTNSALPFHNIACIAVDNENAVWVLVHAILYPLKRLVKIKNMNFTVYDTLNSELPEYHISSLTTDNLGDIWIGCSSYLIRIDSTDWTIYDTTDYPLLFNNPINSIAFDSQKKIWIGQRYRLTSFDGINWKSFDSTNSGFPSLSEVNEIAIDSSNNKWIGTNKGLVRFDGVNWIVYDTSNAPIPNFGGIQTVLVDREENVWIGSHDIGFMYKITGVNWIPINISNSCLPQKISSIAVDKKNILWVGTRTKGLLRFDGNNWILYDTSNSEIPTNNVYRITVDNRNNKWFGSYSQGDSTGQGKLYGLVKFDDSNWTLYDSSNTSIQFLIDAMASDSIGNLWIGNYSNPGPVLIKFDGHNWTFYDTLNSGLIGNSISAISIEDKEILWVGNNKSSYSKSAISKFNNGTWTTYNSDSCIWLNTSWVNPVVIDNSSTLWAGTGSGLISFNGTTWTLYDPINSDLPDGLIGSIAIDKFNNKWIGTRLSLQLKEKNTDNRKNSLENIEIPVGLTKFDDNTWTNYHCLNSGMPPGNVGSIVIDQNNTKWIFVRNFGIAGFNENGITTHISEKPSLKKHNSNLFIQLNHSITQISYSLQTQNHITLKLFDTKGKTIKTLVNGFRKRGEYQINFNTRNMSNGTYFVHLRVGNSSVTKKMVVVR